MKTLRKREQKVDTDTDTETDTYPMTCLPPS